MTMRTCSDMDSFQMTNSSDQDYQNHILKGVSRTFALTIPQLPDPLRKVVGNGYLLCRIADTIEDEPTLTPAQKSRFSKEFTKVVAGEAGPDDFSKRLLSLLSRQTIAADKDLIRNTPTVIRITRSFTPAQQAALLRCVRIMSDGMADFQQHCSPYGLKDLPEMDRYCYCVAGVVGEMLTAMFCDYSPKIAKQHAELEKLAVSFGQALQMTNILKDIWDDRERGVCWLPRDIFSEVGFDLKHLSPEHYAPAFGEGLGHLIGIARIHLHNALRYVLLIPRHEKGIRRFCLWALGMAILTLRRINQHRDFSQSQQVKISRPNVKAVILVSNLAAYSNTSLRILFYLLTKPLTYQLNK